MTSILHDYAAKQTGEPDGFNQDLHELATLESVPEGALAGRIGALAGISPANALAYLARMTSEELSSLLGSAAGLLTINGLAVTIDGKSITIS